MFLILLFLVCFTPFRVHAAGHPDFQEIILPKYSFVKLLEEYTNEQLANEYKYVKRKLWGWSINQLNKDIKVKFVGDTLFSKANNTDQELSFLYTYEQEKFVETSINVEGDIKKSANVKVDVISGGLESKIRAAIGIKTHKTTIETTRTTLVIPPHRKLSIICKGDAYLNTGVACYYILGLRIKKGAWEYIDVISEYYDYYEEKI